jgi:hypothetical protein
MAAALVTTVPARQQVAGGHDEQAGRRIDVARLTGGYRGAMGDVDRITRRLRADN